MTMENYESFDDFEAAQTKANQLLVAQLRKLVHSTAPELKETVKWGNGCWVNGMLPVIFIHCEDDHTQLGFFGGAQLNDPNKILQGNAQYVRHKRVESENDIDEKLLTPIIKEASTHNYKG